VPVAARRVLDTRQGLGGGGLGKGERREVMVVGVGGLPASGVRAVAVSVTVDRPTRSGGLWVGPAGAAQTGSAMRVVRGASSSATQLVPVGANGRLMLEQGFTQRLHVTLEVLGWFADGPGVSPGGYVPVAAQRVVDTRQGLGGDALQAGQRREVTVVGVGGVPVTGVRAVTVSVTLDRPAHSGNLLVDPAGAGQAGPTVRFRQGKTTSVTLLVPVGINGRVVLRHSSTRRLHLTIDLLGWFADGSGVTPGGYMPVAAQSSRISWCNWVIVGMGCLLRTG
jgi:hypothetical protein